MLSNSLLDRNCLEHEWNDGFAAAGIVFEVFLVGAVFAQSPNGHLVEAGEGEQSSCTKENKVNCHLVNNNRKIINLTNDEKQTWQALRHDGESDPTADFISIVWTRYKFKQQRQRILCRLRNMTLLRARGSEIT